MSGDDYERSGSCQLADADGDQIFERIDEAGGKGHAVIAGGTGKFAGLTGEYDFDTSGWYASVREGDAAGRRHEEGRLAHVRVVTAAGRSVAGRRRALGTPAGSGIDGSRTARSRPWTPIRTSRR